MSKKTIMDNMKKKFGENRKQILFGYWQNSVTETGLFFKQSKYGTPGFFTPYRSLREFGDGLKAPIAMPLVCAILSLKRTLDGVLYAGMFVLDVVTLDFGKAEMDFYETLSELFLAVYCVLVGVSDALIEAVSLLTRLAATLVSASVDLCRHCFPSTQSKTSYGSLAR